MSLMLLDVNTSLLHGAFILIVRFDFKIYNSKCWNQNEQILINAVEELFIVI